MVWSNWMSTCTKIKNPYLSLCTKLKHKWIKEINIKQATLNLIKEKVGKALENIGTRDTVEQNTNGSGSKINN